MANRRMIHTKISRSKQVNQMSEFAQLLFTWAIVHADDFGCMDGDPEVVLATVIPMKRDKAPEDVVEAIKEWVDSQLVYWYSVGSDIIIQFRSWEVYQSGLHKRTKPKYPLYEEAKHSGNFRELHGNSILREENRTEENGTELNGREGGSATFEVSVSIEKDSSSSLDNNLRELVQIYDKSGFGQLNDIVREQLVAILDEFGLEWCKRAFEQAALRNKHSMNYIAGILENWRREGGPRDGPKRNTANGQRDDRYSAFYQLFPDS